MSQWAARRFWASALPVAVDGGFGVVLDGRAVRTPSKTPLVVPTQAMAAALAAEWMAQGPQVDPETMPLTRAANSALDKVAQSRAAVADHLAAYGGTDLLCYRAAAPAELAERQAVAWDPLLDWAADDLGARLNVRTGVMHHPQPAAALARLAGLVHAHDSFALTGLHDLVGLSGSLVLGLAVTAGRLPADAAWALSRIDEDWQAELWGADDLATEAAAQKHASFLTAARFVALSRHV